MSIAPAVTRTQSPNPCPRSELQRFAPSPIFSASARALGAGPQQFPLSFAQKLSPRQAAGRLGVTLSTVYRLIDSEVLAASKVGGRWVIYAASVEELLERRKNTNA